MSEHSVRAMRSRMMSSIRGKNTKPELLVRSLLHSMGFRFRLHRKDLPGKPDIVLPKYRKIIFVNGCFWHGHDCMLFKWPKTNTEFWKKKITGNQERDKRNIQVLGDAGWSVVIVWECSLKGKARLFSEQLCEELRNAVLSNSRIIEIKAGQFKQFPQKT